MKSLLFIIVVLSSCSSLSAQKNESSKYKGAPVMNFYYENYIHKTGYLAEHFFVGGEADEFFDSFTPVIVPEYFFLGTLNGFSLRTKSLEKDKIAQYSVEEKPLVEYLEKYFLETLNIPITVEEKENENKKITISIYSPELMQIKQAFFDQKTGALKEDLFQTDEEIASYLLGVYYRFGRKIDGNNYEILQRRIFIGFEKMFSLLLKMHVRKVVYIDAPQRVPFDPKFMDGEYKFLFEPSQYLGKYLDTIKEEKKKLLYRYY